MANKTIEALREYAINKWAWTHYDYFILEMKDRWDSKDRAYADKLHRDIYHATQMVNYVGADIKALDTGRIETIIEYCRDHKREE